MHDRYVRFSRKTLSTSEADELREVDDIAQLLADHLEQSRTDIDRVHIHGASSSSVQSIVAELLRARIGFREEVVITPEDGLVTRARPDFYYGVAPGRGIIAEVERGGTTTNNHDLKDFWKAHISPTAQHLFLVVPVANWNSLGNAREKPYLRVKQRIGAFFGDARREVDVVSAHVFGYGSETLAPREVLVEGAGMQ